MPSPHIALISLLNVWYMNMVSSKERPFIWTVLCFRPYWRCYYSNTDAIIYVVDSADRDRIGISKDELLAMLRVSSNQVFSWVRSPPPFIMVLLGQKL